MAAELFFMERQVDEQTKRLVVAFRSIANAPKEAKFGDTGQIFAYFSTNRNNSHVMYECGTTY